MSHNAISRIERSRIPLNLLAIGRLLDYFAPNAADVFTGSGDLFDQIVAPENLGSWLKNLRLRKRLQQVDLARLLRVSKVSVCRYEKNRVRPSLAVAKRLRRLFGLAKGNYFALARR